MLYYLFNFLEQCDFPGARMFGYVSFRSLMAVILSLLISAIFGEYFINLLKRKQITETQRDASIDPFNVKKSRRSYNGRNHYYCCYPYSLSFIGETG